MPCRMRSSPNPATGLLAAVLLAGALIGSSGCSLVTGEAPPVADSTFTRVLVDLHMTTVRADQFTRLPPAATDSVLAFHNVQREAFDATLRYYSRHPETFGSLYDTVIDTLNSLRNRNWEPAPDSSARADSTRQRARPVRSRTRER